MYLITCPHANMLGIYYLPLTFIAHETGVSLEGISKTLQRLCEVGFCTYDEQMEYVWVHEMAFYQIGGQLKQHDNRVKGINELIQNIPKIDFLPRFFAKYKTLFWLENFPENARDLEVSSESLLSQEQEQEKEQEQEQKEKRNTLSGKPDGVLSKIKSNKELMLAFPGAPTPPAPSCESLKFQAMEVLVFLNQKAKRAYRPVDANLKLIMARLKSGASVMDCRQVIAKKTREWQHDQKMAEYLRPATLFNATKFEQYRGELVTPEEDANYAE
ncbi:MAG TPA: conserved phage C-terminal domain-containing protein [Gammaproteobacteria bacterium]|nr:conserved phage C-terminal domain-containing protein [Gammaproteobacteria bacterium]